MTHPEYRREPRTWDDQLAEYQEIADTAPKPDRWLMMCEFLVGILLMIFVAPWLFNAIRSMLPL